MKTPYPITNLAAAYDGGSRRFEALADLTPADRAAVLGDVVALRQAAAVACGENPARFSSVAALPTQSMIEVIKSGVGPIPKGLGFIKRGKEWRAAIIEARRTGKLAGLVQGPARQNVVTLEQRVENLIADHGGDVDAAIEAANGQLHDAVKQSLKNFPSVAISVPAAPAVAVAGRAAPETPTPPQATPLSGRERARAAFQKQMDDQANRTSRKTNLRAERPDLHGQSLAAAAINAQYGKGPTIPPPRNLPPMPHGVSRTAQAFNAQFAKTSPTGSERRIGI